MSTGQIVGGTIGALAGFMMGPAGWVLEGGLNGGLAYGAQIGMQSGSFIGPRASASNDPDQIHGKKGDQ